MLTGSFLFGARFTHEQHALTDETDAVFERLQQTDMNEIVFAGQHAALGPDGRANVDI